MLNLQRLKPRARQIGPTAWMVHCPVTKVAVFDSTMDGAIELFNATLLIKQVH